MRRAAWLAGLGLALLVGCGHPVRPPALAGGFVAELRPTGDSAAPAQLGRALITLDGYRVTLALTDPAGGQRTFTGTRSLLDTTLQVTRGTGPVCDGLTLVAEAIELRFSDASSNGDKAQGELTYPICRDGRVSEDYTNRQQITLR